MGQANTPKHNPKTYLSITAQTTCLRAISGSVTAHDAARKLSVVPACFAAIRLSAIPAKRPRSPASVHRAADTPDTTTHTTCITSIR